MYAIIINGREVVRFKTYTEARNYLINQFGEYYYMFFAIDIMEV